MHVQTHIMAGWCTANLLPGLDKRQRLFCMIAAAIPDLDGLSYFGGQEAFWNWHHRAGHNLAWAILSSLNLAIMSRDVLKSFVLYFAQFHLHLLMDIFGSGPGWSIYYLWPFSNWAIDNSHLSWEFFSWQNISIAFGLFVGVIFIIYWKRRTPLEAIMPELDRKIVALLAKSRSPLATKGATELPTPDR